MSKFKVLLIGTLAVFAGVVRAGVPAEAYLARVMDQYNVAYDVYTDEDAGGNHFVYPARMSSDDNAGNHQEGARCVPPPDFAWADDPHRGATCIRTSFISKQEPNAQFNWGGWYLMNGVLQSASVRPEANWGDIPNAGVDLTGATELTFWARGEKGGERVQFFALGVGWNADSKLDTGTDLVNIDPSTHREFVHPDSSPKVPSDGGLFVLSRKWKKYTISLRRPNGRVADLHYTLGGFGWAAGAVDNAVQPITFYIDDISYNKSHLDEPRFLASFETKSEDDLSQVERNAAQTYDNALALLAFLATGEQRRAGLIADAFVEAQRNDRTYTPGMRLYGAVRNVYSAGDLLTFPGWPPDEGPRKARLSGWTNRKNGKWQEDVYTPGFKAGNVAWAMIALIAYHNQAIKQEQSKYLTAASEMGDWVERNCRDDRGSGGYTLGYDVTASGLVKRSEKATEHNIDLYVAFQQLYLATKDPAWGERAEHARKFVESMWDAKEGKFWTGTGADGITVNTTVVPVDIQSWAFLALRYDRERFKRSLDYATDHLQFSGGPGFGFSQLSNGIWYEGTGHMAVAYRFARRMTDWKKSLGVLKQAELPSGALPAANRDDLKTGFDWRYFKVPHVGATAWLVFAELGVNPYWMDEKL